MSPNLRCPANYVSPLVLLGPIIYPLVQGLPLEPRGGITVNHPSPPPLLSHSVSCPSIQQQHDLRYSVIDRSASILLYPVEHGDINRTDVSVHWYPLGPVMMLRGISFR